MSTTPLFDLSARMLTAEDAAWLTFFDAGPDWWCEEVAGFLRQHAIAHNAAGYSSTVLFSTPNEKHVVGFVSVSSSSLQLGKVQGAYPKFGPPPGVETNHVPVWVIPFMGVHRQHQGRTYGEEMHVWLLRQMDGLLGAPRFLYIQCWEENVRGLRFWERLGYREFDRRTDQKIDPKRTLVWMILDRFSITAPA